MIRRTLIALTCCTALVGCETAANNQRALIGGGLGAAAGAALGTLVGGNDRRNALVGAGIGLLAGAAVGAYLDDQQRELEAGLAGSGADIQRVGDQLYVTLPAGVTFATDSATIQPQFQGPLDRVAQTLNQYPQSYIDVVGHTDSQGDEAYNQALSERRAQSVSSFLISRGVAPARLATYGLGETQPIADNGTASGRQANRRVNLIITPATQQG